MGKIAGPSLKKHNWALALTLLIAVLCAYWPAWNGQPVWDDDDHLTKPELRSTAGLARIWVEPRAIPQYYPLAHTVFWLEHRLFGYSPQPYHLLNILLHFFSALLLVGVLRRLRIPGAWLAAWIFALHPVMVESVAWMTELKNTLSGVFFLGAGLAYLRFDDDRKKRHYGLALGLFFMGLLAKSVIVTLPAALLAVLWWKRGRIEWKRDLVPLLPFLAIGAISGLLTVWIERSVVGAAGSEYGLTFLDRCLIAGRAAWFYLYKIVWPSNLVFMYPRWHIDASASWQYLFPVALLVTTVLLWRARNRSRAPLAVLLYFVATLFPALGFFNLYFFHYSFVADHFQYLAAIGPIAVVPACIDKGSLWLKDGLRRPAKVLFYGIVLPALFLLSWNQSGTYSNAEVLYRSIIAKNDTCWLAHANLGILLADRGQTDEALRHYLKALELNPSHARTHNNLGYLMARMGRTDEAIARFQKALELDPRFVQAHNNLGLLYANLGRTQEAMACFERVLQLEPNNVDAHSNLSQLLANLGRVDEAVARLSKAIDLNPHHAGLQNNLAILLARAGRADEAISHLRRALELSPHEVDILENLVALLVQRGQAAEAASVLQSALASARSAGDSARAQLITEMLGRVQRLDSAQDPGHAP